MDNIITTPELQRALKIIKRVTEENEFPPDRVVVTDGHSSICISWFGNGKYGEMELYPTGVTYAWIAYETGIPETFVVAKTIDDSYELNIRNSIIKIQEFIG